MPARKPFRVDELAWAEVDAAHDWYSSRSSYAASAFLAEVLEAFEVIASAPERWSTNLDETRRYLLHHFPFSIIYLDEIDVVTIVAVCHNKRKPGYWENRL